MKIEALMGFEAERLIESPEFRADWKTLYEKCPWGSVFQSEDFVVAWYDAYRSQFTPVVVTGVNAVGELAGLFTLAVATESGQLVMAGSSKAEYNAWLAEPQDGDEFIERALEKLSEKFPNKSLTLLFMLPSTPIEWTKPGRRWSEHTYLKTTPRGLMEIGDGGAIKDTLRKKKQSKINRLKRLGDLHLDRIQTPEELEAIFDDVICCQTLRLRAIHNLNDPAYDPLEKTFAMNLMRRPGIIHASALRLDDKLVSAQIHTYNREQALLGLITHWPFYAKHSPGELHLLMTGLELAREGIPVFDLTPCGHYKDRIATHHDEVYAVIIFFNRLHCVQYKLKRRLAEAAKSTIRIFDIAPEQARDACVNLLDWGRKWSRMKPANLLPEAFREARRHAWHTDELCVYAWPLDQARSLPDLRLMKRDHLPDLLCYQPEEACQPPVNKFIKQALENLEAGHHVYTRGEDGILKQYCWLIEAQERPQERRASTTNEWDLCVPEDCVLLAGYYARPQRSNLFKPGLYQMLRDAAAAPGAKQAYIGVPAENHTLRRIVEEVGFTYQYSSFRKNRLGKVTSWSTGQNQSDKKM